MLTDDYKAALRALKDQATAASAQLLAQDRSLMKAELLDAQQRMAKHDSECKSIVRFLLSQPKHSDLTIETLSEEHLAVALRQGLGARPMRRRRRVKC